MIKLVNTCIHEINFDELLHNPNSYAILGVRPT